MEVLEKFWRSSGEVLEKFLGKFWEVPGEVLGSSWEVVGPEYSCGLWKIDMVKTLDDWEFNNVAGFRCSYGTTVRRVAIQGLVCSQRMIVIQIRRQ